MINRGHLTQPRYADQTPKRTRTPTTIVACPDCHAGVGEPCVAASGIIHSGQPHVARRRLIVRYLRENPLPAPAPPTEQPGTRACPLCARRLPVNADGSLRSHRMTTGLKGVPCPGEG